MLVTMGMHVPGFGWGGAHLKCKDPECNRMCDCCDEEMTQDTTSPGRTDHRLQVELPTLLRGGIVRAAPALGGQLHLPGDRPCHAGWITELDSLRRDCRHTALLESPPRRSSRTCGCIRGPCTSSGRPLTRSPVHSSPWSPAPAAPCHSSCSSQCCPSRSRAEFKRRRAVDEQEFMRQEHCAHIRQTHLIEDLLRCGGLPGREVGVILVVALAERSGAG